MSFRNFKWSRFILWVFLMFVLTLFFEILWDLVAGNAITKNFSTPELIRRFITAIFIAFLFSLFKWEKQK